MDTIRINSNGEEFQRMNADSVKRILKKKKKRPVKKMQWTQIFKKKKKTQEYNVLLSLELYVK